MTTTGTATGVPEVLEVRPDQPGEWAVYDLAYDPADWNYHGLLAHGFMSREAAAEYARQHQRPPDVKAAYQARGAGGFNNYDRQRRS